MTIAPKAELAFEVGVFKDFDGALLLGARQEEGVRLVAAKTLLDVRCPALE